MKKSTKIILLLIVWITISVLLLFLCKKGTERTIDRVIDSIQPQYEEYGYTIAPALFDSNEYARRYGDENLSGCLFVRSLLHDQVHDFSDPDSGADGFGGFVLRNLEVFSTESYSLVTKNHSNTPCSKGNWKNVFVGDKHYSYGVSAYTSFAMVDIDRAASEGYWSTITDQMSLDHDSIIRVDCCAIKGVECVPIQISVMASDGLISEMLYPHQVSEFDSSWEIRRGVDMFLYNPKFEIVDYDALALTPRMDTPEFTESYELLQHTRMMMDWSESSQTIRNHSFTKSTCVMIQTYPDFMNSSRTNAFISCYTYHYEKILRFYFTFAIAPWSLFFWGCVTLASLIARVMQKKKNRSVSFKKS